MRSKRSIAAMNGSPNPHSATSVCGSSAADQERGRVSSLPVVQYQLGEDVRNGATLRNRDPAAKLGRRQLGEDLMSFIVRPTRLHAKTRRLHQSVVTLRLNHGRERSHCDCLISWHRARRLHPRFREAGDFRVRIILPTAFAPARCGWCSRMI